MTAAVSPQTRRNRVTAGRKAAAAKKAKLARFLATGEPVQAAPERGTERGDYSPGEIIDRIRAGQAGGG